MFLVSCVYLVLYSNLLGTVHGYCAGLGANPSFSGPPVVKQVNITTVLVDWTDLVFRVDCADQFLVKSGLVSSPNDYSLTGQLPTTTFQTFINDRIPELEYFYKVIAREDKGWRGVEYNKSPETFFKTSRKKKDLSPVKIQDLNRGPDAVKEEGESSGDKTSVSAIADVNQVNPGVDPVVDPVTSIKKDEDTGDWITDYLVWIIVGSVGAVIILIGVLYNLKKRLKHEGSVQLDIEFDASFSSSDNDSDADEDADDDFHKIKVIEEEEDLDNKDETAPLKDTKANTVVNIQSFTDKKKDNAESKKDDVNDKELTKILDKEVNDDESKQ